MSKHFKNIIIMNTENKCFFSIKLKNGITITGNNPYEVKDFLSILLSSLFWAIDHCKESGLMYYLEDFQITHDYLLDAVVTISRGLYNKDEKDF